MATHRCCPAVARNVPPPLAALAVGFECIALITEVVGQPEPNPGLEFFGPIPLGIAHPVVH